MAYHALSNDSGSDEQARIVEARKIVSMLEDYTEQMTPKERGFLEQISESESCSVKQIFWLRDIKEKYL